MRSVVMGIVMTDDLCLSAAWAILPGGMIDDIDSVKSIPGAVLVNSLPLS